MLTFCDKHGHKAVEEAVKDNAGIKLLTTKIDGNHKRSNR